MSRYRPKTVEEAKKLINDVVENQLNFHDISFSSVDKIREIDVENLTVEVERGATLRDIADQVGIKGLIFAPFTPDKEDLTIGEMYSSQISSLTGAKYGNAKLHVMGLEVLLPSGEILKTGGKTVKNVTGYDLTRTFLSSRETIGIPLVYTLKLLPKEEKVVYHLINMPSNQLNIFLEKLNQTKIVPFACCFWSEEAVQSKVINIMIGLNGINDKVKLEEQLLINAIEGINDASVIELNINEAQETWQRIKGFNNKTQWHSSFKIPQNRLRDFIEELKSLDELCIGFWGNPLQGNVNLMVKDGEKSKELYGKIVAVVQRLGGVTSWYYDFQYNRLDNKFLKIFQQLKDRFDPRGILNPIGGD